MKNWLRCFMLGHEWADTWLYPLVDGSRCECCGKELPFVRVEH